MKTIWVLTNYPWAIIPPRFGATYRTFHIANVLANANHQVNLLSFKHGKNEVHHHDGLTEWRLNGIAWSNQSVWERLVNLFGFILSGRYSNFWAVNRNSWILEVLNNKPCDLIICEQIWIAPLVSRIAASLGIPWILDSHNFYTEIQYRLLKDLSRRISGVLKPVRVLAYRLLEYERKVLRLANVIACVSQRDKQKYIQLGIPHEKILVVPNGIDLDRFPSTPSPSRFFKKQLGLPQNKSVVLFLGARNNQANIRAVSDISKRIAPFIDNAIFTIVGRGWKPEIRKNLYVIGEVESVRDHLLAADIVIAPLRFGGGTKIKVLEYMAARKPIIGTPIAFEGLSVDASSVIIEENIAKFHNHIRNILADPGFANQLASAARAAVEPFAWNQMVQPLLNWINEN